MVAICAGKPVTNITGVIAGQRSKSPDRQRQSVSDCVSRMYISMVLSLQWHCRFISKSVSSHYESDIRDFYTSDEREQKQCVSAVIAMFYCLYRSVRCFDALQTKIPGSAPARNWGAKFQACPSGYRADLNSVCQKCVGNPTFYDWMYLSFMLVVCVSLHWFFIDLTYKRNKYAMS